MPRSVGQILREAMAQKGRELGRTYRYRDLKADSDVDFSYAAKIVKGTRHPSPEVLRSLARALAPYFPLDEAMLAAGYVPDGLPIGIVRRVVALLRASVAVDDEEIARILEAERGEGERATGDGEGATQGRPAEGYR